MRFQSKIIKFDGDLWYYAIDVPSEVARGYINSGQRRVICTLEGKEVFHAALMPNGGDGYFINLNKKRRNKLGLVQGQLVEVHLAEDKSEYGMPMSEELREVLDQDDEAREVFEQLTKGKQRTLIYWADNVKSSHIKIRRGLVLMNHLVQQPALDFKQLNQEMKAANQSANRK